MANDKRFIWLKEREYVNEFNWFYKLMYYFGCLEMKKWNNIEIEKVNNKRKPKQIYSGGFYRSLWGFRFWNPISWIFIMFLFIISLLSNIIIGLGKTLNDIIYFNRQEVSVNRELIKNELYEEE